MAKKYITQEKLKKNTLADIFIFILEKKQTTRREIEYETGFSWGTVSSNVSFLIEKGYISEEKKEPNGEAGRITYLLKPCSNGTVSIGLDVNRSGYSCEILALDSHVVKKFEAEFTAEKQSELISESEKLCQKAVDWCIENGLKIFSIGIAIQGVVNGRFGLSVYFPGINDWQAYNIKEHFAAKFNLPVYLGHDPKCMLLGEMYRQKCDSCILVRIDNGVGMAVCHDGKILDDTDRFELGHTIAVTDGKTCSCGKKGCLEVYATLSAVPSLRDCAEESSDRQNERCAKELCEAGRYMSVALYNVCTLFKPQRLILTGKAVKYQAFVESAVSLLTDVNMNITVDPEVSAAYGVAVESMKSAIRSFEI